MEIGDVIKLVITHRDQHAQAALARPRGKEAFDYGAASGYYLACEAILKAINDKIEEEASRASRDDDR